MNSSNGILYANGKPLGEIKEFNFDIDKTDYKEDKYNFNKDFSASFTIDNSCFNKYSLMQLYGYKFIEDINMVNKLQRRRNKNKRINKKWFKKYGYTEKPRKDVYVFQNMIIGHPVTMKKLIEYLKKM